MSSTTSIKELDYPSSLRTIISKLPNFLQERWTRTADSITCVGGKSVSLFHLVSFLEKENRIAMNPVFGKAARRVEEKSKTKTGAGTTKKASTVSATTVKSIESKIFLSAASAFRPPCLFCAFQHPLAACKKFMKVSHKSKFALLMKHRLCFDCLGTDHRRPECPQRATCDICKQSHPTCLHRDPASNDSVEQGSGDPVPVSSASASVPVTLAMTSVASEQTGCCTMPVIAVKVRITGGDAAVSCYAFLDSGCTDTLITEQLMSQLGVFGRKTAISLSTLDCSNAFTPCYSVSGLEICGYFEDTYVALPTAYSHSSLPVTREHILTQDDISCWQYLSEISFPSLDVEVGIILGGNALKATEPWRIINSEGDGPYAVYTKLGWVVNGRLRSADQCDDHPVPMSINRIHVEPCLEQQVQKYFQLDFSERHVFAGEKALSVEDRWFLSVVDDGTMLCDG